MANPCMIYIQKLFRKNRTMSSEQDTPIEFLSTNPLSMEKKIDNPKI